MTEDDRAAREPDNNGTEAAAGNGTATRGSAGEVRNRLLFWAVAFGITVLFSIWRAYQFADLEPRTDQAFTTAWVRSLIHAERIWPQHLDGAGLVQSLTVDEGSLLNILLRQIALANDLIFTVLSLVWFAVLTFPWGGSMPAQIIASIAAGSLALAVAAALPALARAGGRTDEYRLSPVAVGLVFLLLAFGSSFLNLFSAAGFHNFGVLMLIAGVVAAERWMARVDGRGLAPEAWVGLAIVVTVHGAACFSHYTNVFILPPATVLLIADRSRPLARRMRVAAFYAAGVVLFLSPAIVLALISPGAGHEGAAQDFMTRLIWVFSQEGNSPLDWLHRAGRWFSVMALMTSLPALVLGLAGLAAMARYQGFRLPLIVVSVHFLLGVLMSGFNQYDRTGAYAIPFLFLGMAWSLIWCWQYVRRDRDVGVWSRKLGVIAAALALLATHGNAQWPGFVDFMKVPLWHNHMAGSSGFRAVVEKVEGYVPRGGLLIAWDYPLVHRFRSLSQRAWSDYQVIRPAETLVREWKAGRLQDYASRFGIEIPEGSATFVFAKADRFDKELERSFLSIFGENGFGWSNVPTFRVVERMSWRSRAPQIEFVLYEAR